MAKYPSPSTLVQAIDSGEEDYDELPLEIRKMVDQQRKIGEEVTATPKP